MTTLLRLPQVRERTGLGRTKIYEMMGAGKFPKPVKLSEAINAWPDHEIENWIQSQIAER